MTDNEQRSIGFLEGQVASIEGRLDSIDKKLGSIFSKLEDLNGWKWKITGIVIGVSFVGGFLANVVVLYLRYLNVAR